MRESDKKDVPDQHARCSYNNFRQFGVGITPRGTVNYGYVFAPSPKETKKKNM